MTSVVEPVETQPVVEPVETVSVVEPVETRDFDRLNHRVRAQSPGSAACFSPASIFASRLLFFTGMGQVPNGVKALG